jgi:glycosyltransferase involved in cell wall biosynthesis
MVLTEGMMAGRVAVISDCGNASFYISDGVDGFLSDFPTVKGFSKALELAWESREQWQEMGLIAHRKVKKFKYIAPEKQFMDIILAISDK